MTKTPKNINTYTYTTKRGKQVVVKPHVRNYNTGVNQIFKYPDLRPYQIRLRTSTVGGQELSENFMDSDYLDRTIDNSKYIIQLLKINGYAVRVVDGEKQEFKLIPRS